MHIDEADCVILGLVAVMYNSFVRLTMKEEDSA